MKRRTQRLVGLGITLLAIAAAVFLVFVVPANAPPVIYVVRAGDTFSRISMIHEVRILDLLKANPAVNPRHLEIGDRVIIPRSRIVVRLGYQLDKLAARVGFRNPPFARSACRFIDSTSD